MHNIHAADVRMPTDMIFRHYELGLPPDFRSVDLTGLVAVDFNVVADNKLNRARL
ncbi:MAG: hypothetical protein OXI96_01695 [Acidimicrobiaceae bacterium]|nr:hypothetical protein [Acidimicrobiaceae bacterium]